MIPTQQRWPDHPRLRQPTAWLHPCKALLFGAIAAGLLNGRIEAGFPTAIPQVQEPVAISFSSPHSCLTYSGPSERFQLSLRRGQWLQVEAVDRGIALLAPSGRSLPPAYGTGRWNLPESGTYAVSVEYPAAEGMGVRFCLR